MKNHEVAKFLVQEDGTIHDAMVTMTENKRGAVVVVDKNNILRGVVSDGDIRRAMLKGALEITPISKIMNINTLSVDSEGDFQKEGNEIFTQNHGINVIPVIDGRNKVKDVIIRDEEGR